MRTNLNSYSQAGLSIVELLVALALSSVLLVGLFQIFNSNRQAFDLQGGVARVQESGRISMEFLSRNLRGAGYLGCASGDASSPFDNSVDQTLYSDANFKNEWVRYDGANGITGFENITGAVTVLNNMGLSQGTGNQQIISGTDAFIVHSVEPCPGTSGRVAASTNSSVTIEDAAACGLSQYDVVVVSSCNSAEAFSITSDPTSTNTLSRADSHNAGSNFTSGAYPIEGSYVYRPRVTAFHVGNTTGGEPALFMTSLVRDGLDTDFVTQEIAQGIEQLQVLYGEDTDAVQDGTANRYVTATNVSDFLQVVSIRARMLARSGDRVAGNNQTYTFNGATVTAGDLRLRVPYETTNTIRNRLK